MNSSCQENTKRGKSIDPIDFDDLVNLEISKPARYMGQELGVLPQNWQAAKAKWTLAYPELYEIGASNLGHIILYSILNKVPGQLCDRVYLPGPDLAKRLRAKKKPLFAVESQRPLIAFDLLGFSLSYELGATNILEMIDLANIPIYTAQRKNLPINHPDSDPLVFAGGPTATSNPEPFAAFFDFFALGDGEELLPEIGLVVAEAKENGLKRLDLLQDLAQIPGIYVPSFYSIGPNGINIEPTIRQIPKKVKRRVASPMPYYATGLVPYIETVHDRLSIEIRRGCTRGCRFCQPGMLTRPARDVEPEAIIKAVENGMKKTGYSDFSLLSLSCSDYLSLPSVGVEIKNKLINKNVTLQLPSQRVDRFNDDIAHVLGGSRQAGLTFAPEAGTQRLRDIINKNLSDQDLLEGIRTAMKNKYKKVKLYFMIGLPEERDEDIIGIAETCQFLQTHCKDLGQLKLKLTISNFTPKPHTPFQWHSVSKEGFEHKQTLLRKALHPIKNVQVNFTDVRLSEIEDFIGRGNRAITPVIEAAWRAGAGMDAWFEELGRTYTAWREAIKQAGIEGLFRRFEMSHSYNAEEMKNIDISEFCSQPLPWDHIETGVRKGWLIEELKRALKVNVLPDCSFDSCSICGVCGPEFGHNVIIEPPPIPAQRAKPAIPAKVACRIRVSFSKTGPMALLSHLDLMRLLERAFRRSDLPVSYTNGFHPLPKIQIGLALPLGVEAFGEWMDIEFNEQMDAENMIRELQGYLPSGIKLLQASLVDLKEKSLSQMLIGAIWTFTLSSKSTHSKKQPDWGKAVRKLIESNALIWNDKDKKGRPRERDCKNELQRLELKKIRSSEFDLNQNSEASFELEALIDQMGRSIKPVHIQHWLANELDQGLNIKDVKRQELLLLQC